MAPPVTALFPEKMTFIKLGELLPDSLTLLDMAPPPYEAKFPEKMTFVKLGELLPN